MSCIEHIRLQRCTFCVPCRSSVTHITSYIFCTGQVLSHGSRFVLMSQLPVRTSQRLLLLNSIVEQLRIITPETIHPTPDWTNQHSCTISLLRSCRPFCAWSKLLILSSLFHKSKTFFKPYNQSMSAPNRADQCEYASIDSACTCISHIGLPFRGSCSSSNDRIYNSYLSHKFSDKGMRVSHPVLFLVIL